MFSSQIIFVIVVAMATSVLCRRHHHYHYHLGNNSEHRNENRNFTSISQKLTTINADSGSDIETFTPYTKHTTG